MSTRGFVGFVASGATKIGYNHSDSYPESLGLAVLQWLRKTDQEAAFEAAVRLRVVDPGSEPTDEDVEALQQYLNPSVGGRSERTTWYQLLRETQGDPEAILDAGAMEDASKFPGDSLFAEWGYVVDFDDERFEVYRGFQKEPHEKGRFASMPLEVRGGGSNIDTYYPVALISSWPLAELPSDEDFLAAVNPETDDDN